MEYSWYIPNVFTSFDDLDNQGFIFQNNKNNMDKLLFTNDTKSAKDLTSDLRSLITSYCIDTSGSTGGAILRCEIKSATNLSEYLQPAQIIGWNHKGTIICYIISFFGQIFMFLFSFK